MGTETKSTRLSIVEQSIEDMIDRLDSLPVTPRVRELRAKVKVYERAVLNWPILPPTQEQRSTMLKSVIELHVEVMELGREGSGSTDPGGIGPSGNAGAAGTKKS